MAKAPKKTVKKEAVKKSPPKPVKEVEKQPSKTVKSILDSKKSNKEKIAEIRTLGNHQANALLQAGLTTPRTLELLGKIEG